MNGKKKGFTLIELLVVVLIIGILAAIALPQYQKAVLKSRYTTLMPIAKGIAEGNEAYFMEHGTYAEDPTELPIKGQESYPDGTTLDLQDTDEYTYVLASRADLPGLHHIIYQHHSKNFPSETHCEAAKDNKLANWVCKDAFKGTKLGGSLTTGYNSYLLDGAGHGITATAAAVLAGVACADGLDEDHCKVTENSNGTKTKKECENPSDTTTCTWTTFNTDETKTVCDGNNATYTSSGCVPAGKKGEYETTYDEDGSTIIGKKECDLFSNKGCSRGNLYTYNDDGSYQKKIIMCEGGTIEGNGGCTKGLGIADDFYDEHGNQVYDRLCENPTSLQCENYKFGDEFINSYDTNNQLSYVEKRCFEYYPNSTMCVPDKLYETGARVPIYEGDVYTGYNKLECLDGIVNGKCDGWYLSQYDDSGTLVIDEAWCEGNVNLVTATCTISN